MELEINGITADIGNASIAITKKTIDLNDIEQRFIEITNAFNLPDTETNRQIFNSPLAVNSTNDSFDVLYNVKIIDQTFLMQGYGILNTAKKGKGYNFQVIDKSKDIFDSLEENINSIDFDTYDTVLSAASQTALATESITHPLVWPKVACHEKKIPANLSLDYWRPSLFLPAVLNMKLISLGYTFTSVKNLAVSLNHDDFLFTSYQKTINATIAAGFTGLDTNDIEVDVVAASGSINIHSLKTRFRIRGIVDVTGASVFTVTATNPLSGDVEAQSFSINEDDTYIDFTTNDFQTDDPDLNITFDISGGSVEFTDTLLYSLHSEKDSVTLDTSPFLNYKIKVYDNLPDISFKDIYRTICLVTNSIHIIDTFAKTFTFKSFSGLQKMNALDWSDKFIQDTDTIDSNFSKLAKSNLLKYNNDATVARSLGEDSFATSKEQINSEADFIKLPFSASDDVIISGQSMTSINIYNDTQRIPDRTINIRIYEVSSGLSNFSALSWKVLKLLYSGFFDSLNRIRQVSCEMDLKKLDVLGWDLVQVVYIDYYSCYFIIQEIDNFVSGLKTNVKLLKYG